METEAAGSFYNSQLSPLSNKSSEKYAKKHYQVSRFKHTQISANSINLPLCNLLTPGSFIL